MTDAKLKSLAERINRLLDEKQGIGADITDIFQEAKSAGFVPKVLRKAITRQRMEPAKRQEEDSILELYEAALDGPTREAVKLAAQGATSREIEQATGIDHVTVSRSVSLKKKHETPNAASQGSNPHRTAGEEHGLNAASPSAPNGEVGAGTNLPSSAPVAASEKEVLGTNESCGGADSTHSGEASDPAGSKSAESPRGLNGDKPVSNPAPQDSEEGGDRQSASRGGEASADVTTASASSPPPIAEYVFPYSQAELEAEYPGITAPDRDPSLPPEPDLTIPAHLRRTA